MLEVLRLGKATSIDPWSNVAEVYHDARGWRRWSCLFLATSVLPIATARYVGGCDQMAVAMDDFLLRLGVHPDPQVESDIGVGRETKGEGDEEDEEIEGRVVAFECQAHFILDEWSKTTS